MKVKHKANKLNDEEINKQKRNENDGVDNATVKGDCNCHQSKIFEKKISAGRGRRKKGE